MSSRAWQRLHGVLVLFWVALTIVAHITGWVEQTRFVSDLSLVALILASISAWQAARAEVKVDKAARVDAGEVKVQSAGEVNEA